MTEMTMVERVSRVLCARNSGNPDALIPRAYLDAGATGDLPAWREWEEDARAAIAAMREPVGAMNPANWVGEQQRGEVWRDCIDAALAEPQDGREPHSSTPGA